MKRTVLALALVGLLVPGTADAKRRNRGGDRDKPQHERALPMEQGTWQLGGSATIDFSKVGDTTDFSLALYPDAGYFVADKFEILGQVGIFYDEDTVWDAGAGVRYHFDVRPGWFYVGALGILSGVEGSATDVQLQAGYLYPLARNVGLDLGLRANIWIPDEGDLYYSGGLGYLGVQAYWR